MALLEILHQRLGLRIGVFRKRLQKVIPLVGDELGFGETLARLYCDVGLPRAPVQRARHGLDVGTEGLDQVCLRTHLLLRVRDSEGLVQDWIELDLTTPPVVVVLAMLNPHEEPAVVDLATGADDRYSRPVGDANA